MFSWHLFQGSLQLSVVIIVVSRINLVLMVFYEFVILVAWQLEAKITTSLTLLQSGIVIILLVDLQVQRHLM